MNAKNKLKLSFAVTYLAVFWMMYSGYFDIALFVLIVHYMQFCMFLDNL